MRSRGAGLRQDCQGQAQHLLFQHPCGCGKRGLGGGHWRSPELGGGLPSARPGLVFTLRNSCAGSQALAVWEGPQECRDTGSGHS